MKNNPQHFDAIFALVELAQWIGAVNLAFGLYQNCYGVAPLDKKEQAEVAAEIASRRVELADHLKISNATDMDNNGFVLHVARRLFGSVVDMPFEQQRAISVLPDILWRHRRHEIRR